MFSDDDDETPWWKMVLGGVIFMGLSVYLYWDFTDFETQGGTRRINWLIAWMYNIGGKWTPCIVFMVCGIAAVAMGIVQYRDEN